MQNSVLIVGAGPTGLALALFLANAGVTPRIIDRNSGPGQASRAMAVQARTLEFYRQIGIAEEVIGKGIRIEAIQFRAHGQAVSEIKIGDIGKGLSPYPFVLSFPQDDHERLLTERLRAMGIEVEWDTELLEFRDTGKVVQAVLRNRHGTQEHCAADYVCGCDGAHSVVRHGLQLGFAGGTYDQTFFVADVHATGEATENHKFCLCVEDQNFLIALPVRSTGMTRLIGIIPAALTGRADVAFDDIRPFAEQTAGIHVETVNWFSTYRVHHRVADHFRVGRAFILGDAGHIHSPAGGQGMNTGIGDAVNLAWKLAAVLQQRASASILDTYESERVAFARSLVATTDTMFQTMTGAGIGSRLFREAIVPRLAPLILGFSGVRHAAFRLVSQTRIDYRMSVLSEGAAGNIHSGNRLPWVPDETGGNFAPLTTLDWQVHVYGTATQALHDAARDVKISLHEFDWRKNAENAGLMRDALYLIRPDGYVALADARQDGDRLKTYLSRFRIASRKNV